ncbi:serine/threonine-protein kinase [Sandaracinus amylolyticus]|uniref:serine/threonine-protein kinase n=1 Tax=Sandaracinus amylolyticus TaxID=927083 RepID=UPI001F02578E|nr:serine/threonine-protein kinase [Sandaracinus amylolyticus]UJR79568.1 Serine/threonine protein kinase [Sandaracinus amylolyticus]
MPQVEGAIIGDRYRLVRKIGEGGMASVWEAEHVALGSMLAVKFLHRTAPKDSEVAQRFLREARVAASVKHRNVVDINDFGFTDDDVPYMVMERLVGESLADYLANIGPLDFDEAARLASLTLRGLSAVHDAGIVHRDLKPDNIFLIDDEDGRFPKLLDFGLSRRAGRTDMTIEGTLMGTPDYMSPEQARGQTDLDARTDIYSMGVILYEMITARMPYESELVGDLIAMIARDPPAPVRSHRPDAPDELVEVIERAMSKNREERFPNAREMRNALVDLWGGAFHDPGSGLTSLSEMPLPNEVGPGSTGGTGPYPRASTPTGNLRRPRPRSTASGARVNPALPPRPSTATRPSQLETRDDSTARRAAVVASDPALSSQERVALADAPTLAAMPTQSPYSSTRPPPPATGSPSRFTSLLALALAAATGATFAWVWLANAGSDEEPSAIGATAASAMIDAGIGPRSSAPDAGVSLGTSQVPSTAGLDAGLDAGPASDEDEIDEPRRGTKQRGTKRRGTRRPVKRRGGRRR